MTIRHPLADRDASPAAVTVGADTYQVDGDGVVDCPPDEEQDVADVLAAAHGVDRDRILTNNDDGDDGVLVNDEMTHEEVYDVAVEHGIKGRSSMTKAELIDALSDQED